MTKCDLPVIVKIYFPVLPEILLDSFPETGTTLEVNQHAVRRFFLRLEIIIMTVSKHLPGLLLYSFFTHCSLVHREVMHGFRE